MPEVPRVNTPATPVQLASHLVHQHRAIIGKTPTRQRAELLLAQLLTETANGASQQNWNPGNISTHPSSGHDYWRPPWYPDDHDPKYDQLHAEMVAKRAPEAFRAYADQAAGMAAYVGLLKARYPDLLSAASSGDAGRFARTIQSSSYCPDCEPSGTAKTLATYVRRSRREKWFEDLRSGSRWPLLAIPAGAAAYYFWWTVKK